MANKKILQKAVSNLDKAKAPAKKADIDYVSKMGYRDDSPFNKRKSITINTPDGSIDMSNTGQPLIANGKYLPPYSGIHQFDTNEVIETKLDQAKKGGSKKYSKSLLATNRLFKKNPLFKKPKYKGKTYDPSAMYFEEGGSVEMELTPAQIQKYVDGGYVVEDISVPQLTQAQTGINTDGMTGMMKARLAYANEFGNPAAQRMINLPDNPYQFDDGNTGTHYMASMDNYAVPQIQDENGVLQLGDYGPESNEAIRFDSDEDANYFAENYKDVSPGFLNEKKKGGALLTKKVTCKKCGWKWDAADGGNDVTTCHKCGGQGIVHAQDGTIVKDNIIYPPGDSEYMNQPALNYDIIEMLNQKARRDYEEYIKNRVDPTNINRASPRYQQEFIMGQGLIHAQEGGGLPKAQEGYINFTPYSNRGDMPGVETFGSKNPTMNIGYTRDITGRLVKDQGFEKAIGNVTAKLPYNNNTGVGIQGGLKLVGDRIKAIQDVTKANVETDFIAGYDPKLGFHSSLIASPQFTFGNVQPTMSKVYGTGLKSGEWLVKAGPYAGVSAIPGRDLREQRFSIPAGVKTNIDFGLGRKGIKAGLSGYFGVDAFGQSAQTSTNNIDTDQTKGRTHYGFEAGLKVPLNLPVNWAKKLIAEKEKEDDYYTPKLNQGGELNKYQLAGAVQNDAGYKAATEELQAIIKQRDNDLTYARTPALKAQINKQYDQAIKDATFRQQNAYKAASTAGTEQVKNIIATSNEAAVINAEKAKIKKQEEARRQKEAADRALNPEFYNSETLPAVARRSGALLTDYEVEQDRLLKESLAEQRAFVAKDYINNNREALINENTNEAKSRFKNLDWDKAKELAMFSIDNIDNLKSQFPNATPAEIEQYKIFIGDAREKIKSKAYNYVGKVDLHDALKTAGYYREPWSPERDQIKAVDPNDPTHVEMSGRMPQTLGEWGTRLGDIVFNPLDAIQYGMTSEEMPINMADYEKAKSQLGYEDAADKNLIMQGLDFASWMHPVGMYAQGMKMVEPTAESILTVYNDPTWENAGNAALNLGMNALAFAGAKTPLNFLAKENAALKAAEEVKMYNFGSKLNKFNRENYTGPQYYSEQPLQKFLPLGPSNAPISGTVLESGPNLLPIGPTTEIIENTSGYKYGSLYSKPVDNVTGATPLLDTEISLYRQQPKGFTNEYTGPDDPRLIEHVGWGEVGDPNYQAPIVFPYDTVGNWWDSNANRMTNTGVSPNTQFSLSNNPQQEVEILKVNLPFSEASKYAASKNPEGAPWALQDTEYILPEKYKAEAESTPFVQGQSPVTSAGITDESSATLNKYNVKGQDAKKQFLKDLQEDSDYNLFKENAKIKDLETGAWQSSYGVPNVQNDFFQGQGLSEENTLYSIAEQPESVQKLSGTDDQVVSSVFNDIRDRKVDLWQTPEGQQRLQKMIDNTPSLEGQTPQTLVERMVSLKNTNTVRAERQNRIDNINKEIEELDDLEAEGVISQNDVVLRNMKLDEELKVLNQAVADEQEYLSLSTNRIPASYNSKTNTVDVNPDVWSETDLRKVTSHELGHVLGVNDASLDPTYLDDMLGGLDLVKNTSRQLSIPGLENGEPSSGAHGLFGEAKENYIEESIRYFKEGSGGTEKVPMLSEVREDLLEKGIIKTEYDPITPKMLKDHFKDYKSVRGEKYPLRIYDIIKDKPDNFSLLAKTLNYLPYVAIGVSAINDATNDDENVSEAGFSGYAGMVAALALFSKKPKFKLPKKAIAAGAKFLRSGYEALSFKDKDLMKEWFKLDDLIKEKNKVTWDSNDRLYLDIYQAENIARDKFNKISNYQKNKRLAKQSYRTKEDIAIDKRMTQTAERHENVEGIEKTSEGLLINIPSIFEGITKTGQKQITDFSTGNQVAAEVILPNIRKEFKKVNGQLVSEDKSVSEAQMTPEYPIAIKNSINQVQTDIPGVVVFGSSVLVSEAGMPYLTKDLDLLITESNYYKNVKDKYAYAGPNGPAEMHSVYPQYGEEGTLDFNIIHEDANGNVKPFYSTNPYLADKTPTEIELFRQFYPEQFQEAAKESLISGKPIEINMKASDFLAGIDPKVKTIMDAYETGTMSKWGTHNAGKEKHVNRPELLITYGEPSVVAQGQEAYVKSVVGPKGSLGHQFTKEELSDVNKNIFTLMAMDYPGEIWPIANNPDRMQLMLNDFYINHSIFSREIKIPQGQEITEEFIKKVLTEWTPGYGGTAHGIGLNAVRKGNPKHIERYYDPILGHRQLGFELNTKDPKSYIDSINRATSGNYAFTPEELVQVQDIFKKYLPSDTNRILDIKKSRDILEIGKYDLDSANEALKEFSSTTGIRAISKDKDSGGIYLGGSIYATLLGGFDEAIDAMMYSLKDVHVAPKSINMRNQGLKDKKSKIANDMPKAVVNTLKDFDKISNLLDTGIATADLRLSNLIQQKEAIEAQEAAFRDKLMTVENEAVKEAKAAKEKVTKEIKDLIKQREDLNKKRTKVRDNREKIVLGLVMGTSIAGAAGFIYALSQQDNSSRREFNKTIKLQEKKALPILIKERGIDKRWIDGLPESARRYLYAKPNELTWPTGEPIEITDDGYLFNPKTLEYTGGGMYEWKYDQKYKKLTPAARKKAQSEEPGFIDGFKSSGTPKFEYGGNTKNTIEAKLTNEEIKDYLSRGYIIEEID